MPGLILHTSNRLEILADKLAEVLRQPLRSPLQPETIVVQSQGMARWLKLELAQRNGIWANCHFPFPNAFCQQVFEAVVPGVEKESPFTREVMVWRIMGLLPELAGRRGFEEVRNYLGDGSDGRKRFQLAAKLAYVFDQYLIHRPDWITAWDEGRDSHWQAVLWRELARPDRQKHMPALFREFGKRIARPTAEVRAALPERVCMFGISALPEFHLAVLGTLAIHAEVHCFFVQPSREYFGQITDPREQERLLRKAAGQRERTGPDVPASPGASDFHLEVGNRLLASLGKLGRDFLNLVLDAGDWTEREQFVEPVEDNLLHAIQSDIFHLRDRGRSTSDFGLRTSDLGNQPNAEAEHSTRLSIRPDDRSLQIYSCHSPMREMEVLHDHLLDWFERDPELAPRDVVVLAPGIDAYAPFIQAVFAAPEDESRRIPFSLADRGPHRESQIVATFLALLNLSATRLTATDILAPLETAAVRARFGLTEPDLDLIRHWVRETNIRWGLDAEHRRRLDLPPFAENTWQHGFDRLLLGYAMAGRGEKMFGDILPFDDIEGGTAETLGRFAEYFERLRASLAMLGTTRSVADWTDALAELLADFFADDDSTHAEISVVRAALSDLGQHAARAGFSEAVPLAVLLEPLTRGLQEDRSGSGFLTGSVTFCALKPMRSLPFKVICLVGMNDTAFPRADPRLAFDLMAKEPRIGDRSLREDDRYLFLETFLSARDRLYVSYVGQSIRDNSEAPPSVVVSELMDYIAQGFELADTSIAKPSAVEKRAVPLPLTPALSPAPSGGEGARRAGEGESPLANQTATKNILADLVLTKHRLQAFSPAYFDGRDVRLFSYSTENCAACELAVGRRCEPKPFFAEPLAEPEPELRHVDLAALVEFFRNPAKFLLTRRLGLRLPFEDEPLEESEPFALDKLEAHKIKQDLVDWRLARRDWEARAKVLRAAGRLPPGEAGTIQFQELRDEAEVFTGRLAPHIGDGFQPPVAVDLRLGEFRITGQLTPASTGGLVGYRCADIKPADRLRHWIQHLAWNVSPPELGNRERIPRNDFLRLQTLNRPLTRPEGTLSPSEGERDGVRGPSVVPRFMGSVFVAADATLKFGAVTKPLEILAGLLDLYWRGLQQPLKFFPRTSYAFVESELKRQTGGRAKREPIDVARSVWEGDAFGKVRPEREDGWFDVCFRNLDPLDEEFAETARRVFGPLLEHVEEAER